MRGNAARVLVPALVVLALVAAVAIAASGSTPTGTDDSRVPANDIVDAIVSLGLVALVPAALAVLYALVAWSPRGQGPPSPVGFVAFVAMIAGVTALLYWGLTAYEAGESPEVAEAAFPHGLPRDTSAPPKVDANDPELALAPLAIAGSLLVLAVLAWWYAARRATPLRRRETLARDLTDALDESLDTLRAEPDPRRAVIAAYARLERVLGSRGFPRRLEETPEEYLTRILERLQVEPASVRRLTDLFTEAKFSRHVVDATMKDEAIDALSTVRDELRARGEAALAAAHRAAIHPFGGEHAR
jgi:Domain of unknown function (DUF4129)